MSCLIISSSRRRVSLGVPSVVVTSTPYWANVATQITFAGADASTTFVDNSRWACTVSSNNGAAILSNKLELDGTNDFVSVDPGSSAGFNPGSAFSLETFGVEFDVLNLKQVIACNNNGASGGRSWSLYLSATNRLTFDYWNGTAWSTAASAAWSPSLATAYDVAAMWDGSNVLLYVDGVRVASGAFSGPFATTSTFLRIGAEGTGSGGQMSYMNGRIKAIRWTRGVAFGTDANYVRHALPLTTTQSSTSDPYYPFVSLHLSGQGVDGSTTFSDKSPTDRRMTAVGAAQNDTDVSVKSTPSVLLGADGTYVLGDYSRDLDIDLSATDFCMEAYGSLTTIASANNQLFGRRRNSGQFVLDIDSGNLRFLTFNSTTGTVRLSVPSGMTANTVHHICVMRVGATYYGFIDGVLKGSATSGGGAVSASSVGILVGDSETDQATRFWRGSVNWCRITKGHSRYSPSGFTPPSVPYPTV